MSGSTGGGGGGAPSDLSRRCSRVADCACECIHIAAHDPSMALYRIHEHCRKSTRQLAVLKAQMQQMNAGVQGASFDASNAIGVIDSMRSASESMARTHENLRTAMYFKQQLDYEKARKARAATSSLPRDDSSSSLGNSLHKSRSMGQMGPAAMAADGGAQLAVRPDELADLRPGSASASSHSAASTPVSERPHRQRAAADAGADELADSDSASTPEANGADDLLTIRQTTVRHGKHSDSSSVTSGADTPEKEEAPAEN